MTCFTKQILDYFYNIQNTGRILKPEAIGKAGSKKEGTVIEFSWRVKDGVIEDARFRTFGDVNAIAISSIITTMMIGKSVGDVLNITAEDVLEHLQSQSSNYLYIIDVALNALINTYENYLKKNSNAVQSDKVNEFAENLRKNLEKIENGEDIDVANYDLADISNDDEDSYLENVQAYNKNLEDNSIEKSLTRLLHGYTTLDETGEKETSFDNYSSVERENAKNENAKIVGVSRGRGSPKKERTPEEIDNEFNKIKRGRGRPKKEKTEEELQAEQNRVVRGRGRPRKEKSQEELEKAQSEIKRGRGRPRKINLFDSEEEIDNQELSVADIMPNFDDESEVVANDIPQSTRGRGRPRKEINDEIPTVKKGRGRPRKEKTEEELQAEQNKISRGRGRPRKERTPEEIEAELNKVKRGRGRPKKIENSVFGITKLSKNEENDLVEENVDDDYKLFDNTNSAIFEDVENDVDDIAIFEDVENDVDDIAVEVKEENFENGVEAEETYKPSFENELATETTEIKKRGRPRKENVKIVTEKKGRGRPKKERTPEEIEAELNKVVRGRGRPKKEKTEEESQAELNNVSRGRGRPKKETTSMGLGASKPLPEIEEEPHKITVEDSEHHFATLENSFAPAQNKYGVGVSQSTQYNVHIKKTKITKHYEKKTEMTEQPMSEVEEEKREPLSDNVSSLLKNSSIQDALKVLLGEDEE